MKKVECVINLYILLQSDTGAAQWRLDNLGPCVQAWEPWPWLKPVWYLFKRPALRECITIMRREQARRRSIGIIPSHVSVNAYSNLPIVLTQQQDRWVSMCSMILHTWAMVERPIKCVYLRTFTINKSWNSPPLERYLAIIITFLLNMRPRDWSARRCRHLAKRTSRNPGRQHQGFWIWYGTGHWPGSVSTEPIRR